MNNIKVIKELHSEEGREVDLSELEKGNYYLTIALRLGSAKQTFARCEYDETSLDEIKRILFSEDHPNFEAYVCPSCEIAGGVF
jgi:hypothetical protein